MKSLFIPTILIIAVILINCKEEEINRPSFVLTTLPEFNSDGIIELYPGDRPTFTIEIFAPEGFNKATLSGDFTHETTKEGMSFPITNTQLKLEFNSLPITGHIGERKNITITVFDDKCNSSSQEVVMEIMG